MIYRNFILLFKMFYQLIIRRCIVKKIDFFKSHVILLEEKSKVVLQIAQMLENAKNEYQSALNIIAEEIGISEVELHKWRVSQDRLALEKFKEGD